MPSETGFPAETGSTLEFPVEGIDVSAVPGVVLLFDATGRAQYTSADSDTAETKKTRVRKERTKEKKPVGQSQEREEESTEEEPGFFESCALDCLGGMLESLLSSDPAPEEEETTTVEAALMPAEERGDAEPSARPSDDPSLPYKTVVEPLNPHANEVSVWDNPGGRQARANIIAQLPAGTYVTVTESSSINDTRWVKVEIAGAPEPVGWVQGASAPASRSRPEPSPPPSPSMTEPLPHASPEPPSFHPSGPARWRLAASFAAPVFTREAISEEYGSGIGTGVEMNVLITESMHLYLSVGYLHADGEPLFDYVIGSITESPSRSDLDVWHFDLGFGHRYSIVDGAAYVAWGVGPSLFHVRESADITVLEDGLETGSRTETLSRWKAAGQARVGAGGLVGGRVPIGIQTRYSVFPWDSNEEKSLTLDFLGKESIGVLSVGIGIGYLFY
jgi:hypothetical protein